jgi:SAM-dependent methyltransferase
MLIDGNLLLKEAMDKNVSCPNPVTFDRVPTLNGMGYIFYKISPLAEKFLDEESNNNKILLEIGCGFGNVALKCLAGKIKELSAMDLSQEHLQLLTLRIWQSYGNNSAEYLQKLKLFCGKAPYSLPDVENYYDAILIDKVLHFLLPDEIKDFFKWANKALKVNGKIYISTVSYRNPTYGEKLINFYLDRQMNNIPFHGFMENVRDFLGDDVDETHPSLSLPKQMIAFSLEELRDLAQEHNLNLESHMFLKQPGLDNDNWTLSHNESDCDFLSVILKK